MDTTPEKGELSVEKARQAASHPNWMRANVKEASGCSFLPVVVTPAVRMRRTAGPHAQGFYYWRYVDFVNFTDFALGIIRELR